MSWFNPGGCCTEAPTRTFSDLSPFASHVNTSRLLSSGPGRSVPMAPIIHIGFVTGFPTLDTLLQLKTLWVLCGLYCSLIIWLRVILTLRNKGYSGFSSCDAMNNSGDTFTFSIHFQKNIKTLKVESVALKPPRPFATSRQQRHYFKQWTQLFSLRHHWTSLHVRLNSRICTMILLLHDAGCSSALFQKQIKNNNKCYFTLCGSQL